MNNSIVDVNINSENDRSYPIIIGSGLLNEADSILSSVIKGRRAVVITNTTIENLYREKFKINAEYIVIEDGEEFKNFATYKKILDKLVDIGLQRKDFVIALGGGVVGDISGFAAASYMRGINFIQVPTTLLALVDSSVGGKVAINHEKGKNLIGAFYQPKLVLGDVDVLETLDEKQFKSGLGEILKYAFIERNCGAKVIYENSLFEFLLQNIENVCNRNKEVLCELIKRCCELKAAVVKADEKESGLRAILNFGHTFAHAIETCTNYTKYTHGEAVAIGMMMAFDLSFENSLITEEYRYKAQKLIKDYKLADNFSHLAQINKNDFIKAMTHDKKNDTDSIRFVLALDNGECKIENITDKNLIKKVIDKYVG